MSTTKRRQRRAQQHAAVASAPPPHAAGPAATQNPGPRLPEWKWKTFPVYFAFWLGALIFLQLGIIAGAVGESTFTTIVSAVVALFLGFGVARLTTMWMRRHNWVKPRTRAR